MDLLARRFEENRGFYRRLGFSHFSSTLLLELYPSWAVDLIIEAGASEHSLEHPSVGFQAARAAFAELSIDPESVLEGAIKWPGVLATRPRDSFFMYDHLPRESWSAQMFLDFERFSKVQSGLTFHRNRVAMLAHEFLGGPYRISEDVWRDYERLWSGSWEGVNVADLERIWKRHQRAITSFKEPDTAGFLAALQQQCKGKTQCRPLIMNVLGYYNLMLKPQVTQEELEQALGRLVEIIKKGPKNS
jgi:hypothetical protein